MKRKGKQRQDRHEAEGDQFCRALHAHSTTVDRFLHGNQVAVSIFFHSAF